MFRDKVDVTDYKEMIRTVPSREGAQSAGKTCKLHTNLFKIGMCGNGSIFHYAIEVEPASASLHEEEWLMRTCWESVRKHFNGVLVVRFPGHIFTPCKPQAANFQVATPANTEKGYEAHRLSLKHVETISPQQVACGKAGLASVVFQNVVKRIAGQMMCQKVGRRYYGRASKSEAMAQLSVIASFYAGIHALTAIGPLMKIDTLHRVVHKKNILEYMASALEGDPMQQDAEVQQEWRRRCIGATVMTLYNGRLYCIKDVDFSMTPFSTFKQFHRDVKDFTESPFVRYYQAYYQKEINETRQPMLVARSEKEHENVYLVPELCAMTGLHDDIRKEKNLISEALKSSKVTPAERFQEIVGVAKEMAESISRSEDTQGTIMNAWKLQLNPVPVEVEATVHETVEVCFGQRRYPIEDGSFQKYMRNGLTQPMRIDNWLLICPESDLQVLEVWLPQLSAMAFKACSLELGEPTRLICSDQRKELVSQLEKLLAPDTQLVLLLTPQADSKAVYQLFKSTTVTKYPCLTQVVKSETIRKRQSIAAVLTRIILQINAKVGGPLWHLELETQLTAPAMKVPTMVIGLDVFRSVANEVVETYVGFAASLDRYCAEYFSTASCLEHGVEQESMSSNIHRFMKEAVTQFSFRNQKILPQHFIVYRASANEDQWWATKHAEIDAIVSFLSSMNRAEIVGQKYMPSLTFVAISKNIHTKFFLNTTSAKNPEPGTIIDSKETTGSETINFYLINHSSAKGTAMPTHYTVLYDTFGIPPVALQSLTYRLSYLYFNHTGSIRIPAPAQYAKKIAHMIGTSVRAEPDKRLQCSFFYL